MASNEEVDIIRNMDRAYLEVLVTAIYQTMDGKEWNSDTTDTIATIMLNAGLPPFLPPE